MKKAILTKTFVIIVLITTSAFAQGFYLGAGIGNTFYSSEVEDAINQAQKISENSTAWKIFAGYRLTNSLVLKAGIEVSALSVLILAILLMKVKQQAGMLKHLDCIRFQF